MVVNTAEKMVLKKVVKIKLHSVCLGELKVYEMVDY
jgi:hypothetical protein